jgi:hypothetical protein
MHGTTLAAAKAMTHPARTLAVLGVVMCLTTPGFAGKDPFKNLNKKDWIEAVRRAQVWRATDVASKDLKAGPGEFAPGQEVSCEYFPKKQINGNTPKFWCELKPGDEVKVKYGEDNGEVYGEVAATRLLWALGFGADEEYPVVVTCRGCSSNPFKNREKTSGQTRFDPAALERPMPGDAMEYSTDSGWSWVDLNSVDTSLGGAPLAHRDALKLLAVFIQHTDSKPAQQRLVCLDKVLAKATDKMTDQSTSDARCEHPFMMLNDIGLTFGKANAFNRNQPGSVNLKAWAEMKVWKDERGCVGNLPKSMTGTLENPRISEGGRKFLADLLNQLSDQQIRDLFEVSRVTRREKTSTIDGWVNAFKQKRDEVSNRVCTS